jgi:hypothetical protein
MNRAALKQNSDCRSWPNVESSGEVALGDEGEMNLNPLLESGSRHCAYNETRECFLGLHILIADIEAVQLGLRLTNLSLKSGEGLWLKPFRGIPPYSGGPLDLVYLDEKHRVIETVESFPTFQVSPASPRAATVLVLPVHSIYWSQTQPGDQLMLCGADEMQNCLREQTGTTGQPGMPFRERPPRRNEPEPAENKGGNGASSGGRQAPEQMIIARPALSAARRLQNWLRRWWSPPVDPRRAPREPAPGLTAYYWTGGAPKPHEVRDISSTGLYLVTESRWYPGTVLLMNLQRTGNGEETGGYAIPVHSLVIRSGADGVGLEFVLDEGRMNTAGPSTAEVANSKQLELFLRSVRKETD